MKTILHIARYLLLISIFSLYVSAQSNSQKTVLFDETIQAWSKTYLDGNREAVLKLVEENLRSSSPHPLAPQVWCFIQHNLGQLKESWEKIQDEKLRKALGVMPDVFQLDYDNEYKQLLKKYPPEKVTQIKDIMVLDRLAIAAREQRRYDDVIKYTTELIRLNPNFYNSVWSVARDLGVSELYREKALKVFGSSSAFSKTPFSNAIQKEFQYLPTSERISERLMLVEDWLKESPNDYNALRRRGGLLELLEKYEEAAQVYANAIKLFPFTYNSAIINYAEMLIRLKRDEEAHKALIQYSKLRSTTEADAKALTAYFLAGAYIDVGENERARDILVKAESDGLQKSYLYDRRAQVEISDDKKMSLGVEYAKKAVALSPNNATYQYRLINAYRQTSQLEEAYQLYTKYDKQFSQKNEDVYGEVEAIFIRKDLTKELKEEWVKVYREAVAEFPDSGRMHRQLAYALINAERDKEGQAELLLSFEVENPTNWALKRYITLVKKNSNAENAISELNKLVKRFPWISALNDYPLSNPITKPQGIQTPIDNTAKLVTQLGHSMSVTSIAVSPDGRFVVTGSDDGTARLWETASGREIRTFEADNKGVNAVAFSPDNRFVAIGGDEGKILICSVVIDGCASFQPPSQSIFTIAFSPDGKYLVTGGNSPTAIIWEFTAKEVTNPIDKKIVSYQVNLSEKHKLEGNKGSINAITFSNDGRFIITATDKYVYLWSAENGKYLKDYDDYQGHNEEVTSISFSPDDRFVLTGCKDKKVRLWDMATGILLQDYRDDKSEITAVNFSPDGKQVVAGTKEGKLHLWDMYVGTEFKRFTETEGNVNAIAFTHDKKFLLTANADKTARMYDFSSGERKMDFKGRSDNVTAIAYSQKGNFFVIGGLDNQAHYWNAAEGKEIRNFVGHTDHINAIAISEDEKNIATGSSDQTVKVWDTIQGKEIATLPDHLNAVMFVSLSPDGKYLFSVNQNFDGFLWEIPTKKLIKKFINNEDWNSIAAFSADSKFLVAIDVDRVARVWETATGKLALNGATFGDEIKSVAFSSDGKIIATGSHNKNAYLWDASTGHQIGQPLSGHNGSINALSFSSDNKLLLTGSVNTEAKLWNTATSALIKDFGPESKNSIFVKFSPDGRYMVTGGADGVTRLWNVSTGKQIQPYSGSKDTTPVIAFTQDSKNLLIGGRGSSVNVVFIEKRENDKSTEAKAGDIICRLISFNDKTWAVVDDRGRYDASYEGKIEGLHWVVNNESISLDQLRDRYWEANLLSKVLGYTESPRKDVTYLKELQLFPLVEYSPPPKGSKKIEIKLTNRGGGIGVVQVYVNERRIIEDARSKGFDTNAKEATLEVDLSKSTFDEQGENTIRVVAFSEKNSFLQSRGSEKLWEGDKKQIEVKPNVYAIVAGISDYQSKNLKLNYAAKDAIDIANALEVGAKKLFGADRVHVTLLTTANDPRAVSPTKAEFQKAFQQLRSAEPKDIIFIYFSGHGIALKKDGEEETYYYLTRDATSGNTQTLLNDRELLDKTTISSKELIEWTDPETVKAKKHVLILDTCAAGTAIKVTESKEDTPEKKVAIARMKDRTGFYILMGSTADAPSYEASQYGQGLLTYSLLAGMTGRALREGKYWDVQTLFSFAEDEVPRIAAGLKGIQQPVNASPRGPGSSFDIGMVAKEDIDKIPLAKIKHILGPPSLQDKDFGDTEQLEEKLRERFREESYVIGRTNQKSRFIYVNDPDYAKALKIRGTYTVSGETVSVDFAIFKEKERLAVLNAKGNKQEIIAAIIEKLTEQLNRIKIE